MLDVKHLSIHFEDGGQEEAVKNVSFQLADEEILGIVGESGSGKTMTALTIAGLKKPQAVIDDGMISLDGVDLLKLDEKEMRKVQGAQIGMIFQEPMSALNPTMKIGRQLEEVLLLHTELPKGERKEKVLAAMEDVELENPGELYGKYPHELSGGMRQRAMLAAAIVCRPRILIADEPTTALDVQTQDHILGLLKKLNRKYGMGILFISHNLRVVEKLCGRVLVMKCGEVVEEGSVEGIFKNPRTGYAKELIAAIPSACGKGWQEKASLGRAETPKPQKDKALAEAAALEKGAPKPQKVLEVRHLGAYYREGRERRQVLRDVSFTLYEGEIVGLVGESGSGKTTLCKCVLGLLEDYEGEVVHHTKRPQMVFQDPYGSLNPRKTIGWILEEPLKVQGGFTREERKRKAEEMLGRVHLPKEFYHRYPRELSGGQRQRVSIAAALLTGTRFILADEPLSALDVTVQARMIELLKELQEREKICYLFVSHDLDVVHMLCDRVLAVEDKEVRWVE
jgi:peptide/nickel transport system ATP-binding protein